MHTLNDEDLARETLIGCKLMSDMYTDGALEAADPALMELFTRLHHEHVTSAHRVWDWLNRHGAYPVRQAHPQEVEDTHRFLDQLLRETDGFCRALSRGYAEPYPRGGYSDYGQGGWSQREPSGYRR